MRSALGRNGLKVIVLAIAAIAAATSSPAANIVSYHTTGSVGTSGVSGPGAVGYTPIGGGSFADPSQFSLGEFLVPGLADGQTTTFSHTPFEIHMAITGVNGAAPAPPVPPIAMTGELNGSFSGANQSNVIATFLDVNPPSFLVGNLSLMLSLKNPELSLVPSTSNGGRTTIQAYLVSCGPTVPEPATISLFLVGLVGIGVRHRLGRRARA
jgi:hypothetical protein